MGVRSPEGGERWTPPPQRSPSTLTAVSLAGLLFVLLIANGRPIGAGDTRPTEYAAASLVQELNLDLDEYEKVVTDPFSRSVDGHRVSIYPVLSAVLAAPVFAAARLAFALDETGTALAGKLAASLLSAVAGVLLFLAVGRRRSESEAFRTALVFVFGTSVLSTSQALWQHPAAVLFVCLALLWLVKAEQDDAWAGRVGLPLSLAVAARHADLPLAAALGVVTALRWPRRLPLMALWALPGVAFTLVYQWLYFGSPLAHGFSGTLGSRFSAWGVGHVGLLLSPAKGLLVFTPVVVVAAVGLVRAFRGDDRWLAGACSAGLAAHWLLIGGWNEWHGGESWGPRMMTDALPLLFLFLPEGLAVLRRAGVMLAVLSIAVQLMGAFAYEYRWERLHQRPVVAAGHPELWSLADSPIVFHARERVVILALPAVRDGRAVVREHPLVLFGPQGSRVAFTDDAFQVRGADPTFGDVHLQRGARVSQGALRLRGRWDGLFLRVLESARSRRLELRVSGHGRGVLYVGEKTFWTEPRWTTYPMEGAFRARHAFHYPDSGGGDLLVTVGRGGGDAEITAVALVPPREPDDVFEVP
jgi:hypothetical protein